MRHFIRVLIVLIITHIAFWIHGNEFDAMAGLVTTLAFLILLEIEKGNKY